MTHASDIEKLLPWYAKGLLEDNETREVETYLDAHPEMRMQLDLIAEEDKAVEQIHASLGAPSPKGLDTLLAQIDAEDKKAAPVSEMLTNLSRMASKLITSFKTPGVQFAAIAAALIIVAQAVIIGNLSFTDPILPKGTFTTASGPQNTAPVATDDVKLIVAFKKGVALDDVVLMLKTVKARVVSGPKANGFFEIAVAKDNLPAGGVKELLKQLQAQKGLIKFVAKAK